jgi:hypothetical protein
MFQSIVDNQINFADGRTVGFKKGELTVVLIVLSSSITMYQMILSFILMNPVE